MSDIPALTQKALYRRQPKALIITMINDHASTVGARRCIQSIKNTESFLTPLLMDATTPSTLVRDLDTFGFNLLDWSYPKSPAETVLHSSGMKLTGYRATDYTKVAACLVSHMRAWRFCVEIKEAIVVLEHDALFTRKFDIMNILRGERGFDGGVLGLNDPRGATRKSALYHERVVETTLNGIAPAPWIDDESIPQGIAGNSAYIIKPEAAQYLLNQLSTVGLWPNDALMCKQFFPWLEQAYPYYTTLQGTPSTTTS
jgi:hypothetical protein